MLPYVHAADIQLPLSTMPRGERVAHLLAEDWESPSVGALARHALQSSHPGKRFRYLKLGGIWPSACLAAVCGRRTTRDRRRRDAIIASS